MTTPREARQKCYEIMRNAWINDANQQPSSIKFDNEDLGSFTERDTFCIGKMVTRTSASLSQPTETLGGGVERLREYQGVAVAVIYAPARDAEGKFLGMGRIDDMALHLMDAFDAYQGDDVIFPVSVVRETAVLPEKWVRGIVQATVLYNRRS